MSTGVDATARSGTTLRRTPECWVGSFQAMAGPCEVLMETDDRRDAERIVSIVAAEARRIERKFSRYLPDNIVHAINTSDGRRVEVDEETARLLDFAGKLHELSAGKFDITSGVLRRAWSFDGSDRIPEESTVRKALESVGWHRVEWSGSAIRLQPGMEIDLGGIGKEYAVDRSARLAARRCSCSILVNFGGDLAVPRPRLKDRPWRVGIEAPSSTTPVAAKLVRLHSGGLATSGDARRFVMRDGVRFGHILDPTTGWPVRDAPRSVTVAGGSCVETGMLATLAMLEGASAEAFLRAQGHRYWIFR